MSNNIDAMNGVYSYIGWSFCVQVFWKLEYLDSMSQNEDKTVLSVFKTAESSRV